MPFFNIDEYEPVAERLDRFWKQFSEDGRIETELVSYNDNHYIVRAKIFVGERQVATGLADERVEQKGVNARNALENAESSSIGRALANFNFQPKRNGLNVAQLRPSREEMTKAQGDAWATSPDSPISQNKGKISPEQPTQVVQPTDSLEASYFGNYRVATEKQINYLYSLCKGIYSDFTKEQLLTYLNYLSEKEKFLQLKFAPYTIVKNLLDNKEHLADNLSAWSNASKLPTSLENDEKEAAEDWSGKF